MLNTIFYKHFRSMSEHKTCEAGVEYETLRGIPFESRPCFCKTGLEPNSGCELAEFPTAEEIAAEEAEWQRRFQDTALARRRIVEFLGGPWKRGMDGTQGVIDCPVCESQESLSFSRSGYNGHIHARCSTIGCVSWME